MPSTAITTAVTDQTITPVVGLEGFQHVTAQCLFTYGSGGTGATFYLQTSFDEGTNWTDVAAFRFPGVAGRAATDLDGSSDYYTRGADLTGNADGKLGLFSGWMRLDGNDDAWRFLLTNQGDRSYVSLSTVNKLRILGRNSSATLIFVHESTTTYTAGAGWHHFLASWDLGNAKAYIYVDDVSKGGTPSTLTDDDIDHTTNNWAVGAQVNGNSSVHGALAELYFALEYLDISVEANRRKFISANGNRVYLGADGSTPTGTQPLIYAPDGDPSDNLGSGGNFTAQGSPTSITGPGVEEIKFQAVKTPTAVAASQSVQDGALTANTILDGVLGDRMRVKYSTTGTFAGSSIKIDAIAKG